MKQAKYHRKHSLILFMFNGNTSLIEPYQIHIGAMAFIRCEYTILLAFLVVLVLAILITISDLGLRTMIVFIFGAFCSAFAGYVGMFTATKSNTRTTAAALKIAFYGGSVDRLNKYSPAPNQILVARLGNSSLP